MFPEVVVQNGRGEDDTALQGWCSGSILSKRNGEVDSNATVWSLCMSHSETALRACLYVRVRDCDSEEIVAKRLKFGEFLSHSPMHRGGHLSTIPLVMGLGDRFSADHRLKSSAWVPTLGARNCDPPPFGRVLQADCLESRIRDL